MNDLIVLILSFYFFLTIVVVIYGKNYNSNIRIFNYFFDSMYVPANEKKINFHKKKKEKEKKENKKKEKRKKKNINKYIILIK
ncbi:hypothetical protein PFDG_03585 [Plasmodium falciparum Dd2]|uniref:Uncharacterized protein n=1 Tax=Plasmodium falciparum (isolate Dd2) TaxID=57267 RepID=A0A0L7M3P8_PLAF4|nr:hypothetical protein PFDG_03585 [Plasmodium falciparum Dd2]